MLTDEMADYQHHNGELDYVAEYADMTDFMLNRPD
jgi:hypothetical protein